MNMKYFLFFLLACGIADAKDINLADCDETMQQDETYWCLMDKYQHSVLELKREEVRAERKLKTNDNIAARGRNNDGTIEYDPYVHLANISFHDLHRNFIRFREQQCKIAPLMLGPVPGYHAAIELLYCKTKMNISQTQWIKDSI